MKAGPIGCNMCAGIISETLIQSLALDGINLPAEVIQRSMDSYVLHNNVGQVRLDTPDLERRIAAIFRGIGPASEIKGARVGFDGYLLGQAVKKGAKHVPKRVDDINRVGGKIQVSVRGQTAQDYDFLAVATGVNTSALRLFEKLKLEYQPPRLAQTAIREYNLGEEAVQKHFGQSVHFFVLDLPGLDFAAIVPKSSIVTVCLLGEDLEQGLFEAFLNSPEVKACMPKDWRADEYFCRCSPRINFAGAKHPFADRMVFLGDCGVSRLYKDGIGAAYRVAKTAATAVAFGGISESDLAYSYGRISRSMERDNAIGRAIFRGVDLIKPWRSFGRALLRAMEGEQRQPANNRPISGIVWDLFTGSASYRDIAKRLLNPIIWMRFMANLGPAVVKRA
jgi:hypothetical protein